MKRALRCAPMAAVAAALLCLLAAWGHLSWPGLVQAAARLSVSSLLGLAALLGANLALCTWKWLIAMRAAAADHVPSPRFLDAMLATTGGALLGQLMPFQLGVGLARAAAGAVGIGSPALNVGTTLYEQLFDLIVLAAAAAVGLAGLILHADAAGWLVLALAGAAASTLAALRVALLLVLASRLLGRSLTAGRWLRVSLALTEAAVRAGRTPPSTALCLAYFSALRYGTLVGWTALLLNALGMSAYIGPIAAALPLLQFAAILPISPGGLGVAEWTVTAVLTAAGAPVGAAVLFAVVARILNLTLMGALLFLLGAARAARGLATAARGHASRQIPSPG